MKNLPNEEIVLLAIPLAMIGTTGLKLIMLGTFVCYGFVSTTTVGLLPKLNDWNQDCEIDNAGDICMLWFRFYPDCWLATETHCSALNLLIFLIKKTATVHARQ